MNSRNCEICYVDAHRAYYAKHTESKNHLENIKQNKLIIPEWLFKEPIENIIETIYNLEPLKQIAQNIIKIGDKQFKKI